MKKKLILSSTLGDFKYEQPAETCLIAGGLTLTGVDEKRPSKNNQVVKVRDFRGAAIDDLNMTLFRCLKETGTHNFAYQKKWDYLKDFQQDS